MFTTLHTAARIRRGQTALSRLSRTALAIGLACGAALLGSTAAVAADKQRTSEIEARYQAERRACLDGRTGQDQSTCLKEAGAARAEALRQRLDNGEDKATLLANALKRCAVQPASERAACELLARGQGMQSGSVRDGGVIKEVVTRTVGDSTATPVQPERAAAADGAAPAPAATDSARPTR